MASRLARPPSPVLAAAVTLLLSAVLLAPAEAQQDPVLLELQARQGEAFSYEYIQDLDFHMPPEFGGNQEVRSKLVLAQTVRRVARDTIHYDNEVRDIEVDVRGAGNQGLDFSEFEGQRFRSAVTRRGEVVALEMDDFAGSAEQIEQSLRQVGFPVLPERPVGVGETWTDTTRMDAAAMALPAEGEIVSVNRTTLRGINRSGGAEVAELRVESSFVFHPARAAIPGMRVEMSGTRADDVRFDLTNGRFLSQVGQQDFLLNMSIPGSAGSFSIQGTARSRAELLES